MIVLTLSFSLVIFSLIASLSILNVSSCLFNALILVLCLLLSLHFLFISTNSSLMLCVRFVRSHFWQYLDFNLEKFVFISRKWSLKSSWGKKLSVGPNILLLTVFLVSITILEK
uniref:Uncharacterized protein n=1 Tax=Cacopsylla melanoneura TaxID=428564 RepID=A0A8D9BQ05_9HEMI